jgi:hypothetical protein
MEISPQYFNIKYNEMYGFIEDYVFESKQDPLKYYGKKHFNEKGMPADGMTQSSYTPMESPKWALNRERYNPLSPRDSSIDPHTNWEAPAGDDFWNLLMAVRKYKTVGFRDNNHDCLADRKNILVNLLGFQDTGISVGGDIQLIYQFSSEHSQFEIYLSTGDFPGNPAEINRYSFSRDVEVRLPCDGSFEILKYIFFQVWGDAYKCDFNKVILSELSDRDYKTYKSIMDTDTVSDHDDFETSGYINHIMGDGFVFDYKG